MSVNAWEIDWNDPDAIEAALKIVWAWDIEGEFSTWLDITLIWDLWEEVQKMENILWVNIQIIHDTESVIFSREWTEIWRLEASQFNNEKVADKEHLYKSVSTDERGKWIASGMFKIFQLAKFKLPEHEYSDKKSGLGFLLSTWSYDIVGAVGDNDSILEIDEIGLYNNLWNNNWDDELWITVKLELRK
jgi:hypothetical protein